MKKQNTPSEEINEIDVLSFEVSRVNQYKDTVFFDLTINGIKIYGCTVVEGKKGDFISFPSKKGKDDKWYSIVYARLSNSDQDIILSEIEKQLNVNCKYY